MNREAEVLAQGHTAGPWCKKPSLEKVSLTLSLLDSELGAPLEACRKKTIAQGQAVLT